MEMTFSYDLRSFFDLPDQSVSLEEEVERLALIVDNLTSENERLTEEVVASGHSISRLLHELNQCDCE